MRRGGALIMKTTSMNKSFRKEIKVLNKQNHCCYKRAEICHSSDGFAFATVSRTATARFLILSGSLRH